MNPELRAFLLTAPGCESLFSPTFYARCGDLTILGPDENTQRSVMGKYFPGQALPAAIDENNLDLRFQRPVQPNGLAGKWEAIEQYRTGLILGPSGSGKVWSGPFVETDSQQLISLLFFFVFSFVSLSH
jgi:hypothetical protein